MPLFLFIWFLTRRSIQGFSMTGDDTYLSVAGESYGIYKEKGSKFLAFAFPVNSESDIRRQLDHIKKKYHDARHHCYAYTLGKDKKIFRASDDGEPNHSAGDPILGQIRAKNLSDVLIIVVRYFGGTKLGMGGLINAYRTAAAEAISQSRIIEKVVVSIIIVDFEYGAMNDVMKVIKAFDLTILEQDFNLQCRIKLSVRQKHLDEALSQLQNFGTVELLP